MSEERRIAGAVGVRVREKHPEVALRRTGRAGRLVVTGGAAAFALVAWMPWVLVVVPGGAMSGGTYAVYLDPGQISPTPLTTSPAVASDLLWWSTLAVLGVVLCAAMWLLPGRLTQAVIGVALVAWLAATGWTVLRLVPVLTSAGRAIESCGGCAPLVGSITEMGGTVQPQLGAYLAAASALAVLVGLVMLAIGGARRRHAHVLAGAAGPATRQPVAAAGTLLAGTLIWAFGFLEMPWATYNCTAVPLVLGSCVGLGANSTLAFFLSGSGLAFDPLAARYAVGLLLVGIVLALWAAIARGASALALACWLTLWGVLAVLCAVAANAGASLAITTPGRYGLPAGGWSGAAGSLITVLGLLVALSSAVIAWGDVARSNHG